MNNFLTLFKHLLFYPLKRRGKTQASTKAIYIALGVLYALIIISSCVSLYISAPTFKSEGLIDELVALILAAGAIAVLFFSVISTISTLFFSDDTPFLLTLPIKAQTVFMAKLLSVYVTEVLFFSALILPCTIVVGISANLGFAFYPIMVISSFLLPAIPLLIIVTLALPIAKLITYFKNRGAVASIVATILLGGFVLAYLLAIGSIDEQALDKLDMVALVRASAPTLNTVANILFPFLALTRFATLSPDTVISGVSPRWSWLVNLGIFALTIALVVIVALLLSNKVYRSAVARALERGESNGKKVVKFSASSSVNSALMKKEWRELFRTPSFATQCLAGIILAPIMVFLMNYLTPSVGIEGVSGIIQYMGILVIAVMGSSMNIGASTCISREGKSFYFVRTIPVSYGAQVKAKKNLYLIISSITVAVSLVVYAITSFNLYQVIFGGIYLFAYNYAYNAFAVLFDMQKPKLDWTTPYEVVKNSTNATVPVLIGMALGIVTMLVNITCYILIGGNLGIVVGYLILTAVFLPLGVALNKKVINKADEYLGRVEF
ncbi:MAG: hypothetical protein IKC64_01605 [Clostridia bacterium]|nr:hypothetical protein [Clostridia bacterium]